MEVALYHPFIKRLHRVGLIGADKYVSHNFRGNHGLRQCLVRFSPFTGSYFAPHQVQNLLDLGKSNEQSTPTISSYDLF